MAELAKKHAQQGKALQEPDKEFLALMEEYISSVSPDREGILNRAVNEIIDRTKQEEDYTMSEIYQQVKSQIEPKKEEEEEDKKEPIDYFIEMLANRGKGKGNEGGVISSITRNGDCYTVNIDNGGGKTTEFHYANGKFTCMQMNGNNYCDVQLENGGMVGSVSNAMFKDDNGNIIAIYGAPGELSGLRSAPTDDEIERRKEVLAAYNAGYDFAMGKNLTPQGFDSYKKVYDSTYDSLTKSAYA